MARRPAAPMGPRLVLAAVALAAAALAPSLSGPARAAESAADAVRRGQYLLEAGGCRGCHTDTKGKGAPLSGGRALKTPFGTFYTPNITPDRETGIGAWSEADFARALRDGLAPDGSHYYPAFPYPSYTGITDRDVRDLWAYLSSLPPVSKRNRPHDIKPPFGWRFLMVFWNWLYFTPGPFRPDPAKSAEWNRGAYLVTVLGHCGECHTPRNRLGGKEPGMALAGTNQGPEGGRVPNITPDKATGIGRWSDDDLGSLFTLGMLPDGDFVGDGMGEVVDNTTSRWTAADRRAVIAYLRSVPPVSNRIGGKKK